MTFGDGDMVHGWYMVPGGEKLKDDERHDKLRPRGMVMASVVAVCGSMLPAGFTPIMTATIGALQSPPKKPTAVWGKETQECQTWSRLLLTFGQTEHPVVHWPTM